MSAPTKTATNVKEQRLGFRQTTGFTIVELQARSFFNPSATILPFLLLGYVSRKLQP